MPRGRCGYSCPGSIALPDENKASELVVCIIPSSLRLHSMDGAVNLEQNNQGDSDESVGDLNDSNVSMWAVCVLRCGHAALRVSLGTLSVAARG